MAVPGIVVVESRKTTHCSVASWTNTFVFDETGAVLTTSALAIRTSSPWRTPLSSSAHVVVAGAGSGKTTLMAQRVVWLVATGRVRPEEVLGLTFTTKAAAELRQRVSAALGAAGLLDRSVLVDGEDVL